MVAWPDTDELAQVLNVDNLDDWETTLDRVLASAIERVKLDVGDWDEYEDVPDDNLAQAALRAAEIISTRPNAAPQQVRAVIKSDIVYQGLMFGHRRKFGIA